MTPRSWKVGVDFGSTYSSSAFCLVSGEASSAQLQHIYAVRQEGHLKGLSTQDLTEFPTVLVYEGQLPHIYHGWSARALIQNFRKNPHGRHIHIFENFKPLIQEGLAGSTLERELAALPFTKSFEDLITDYLTCLIKDTKKRMEVAGYKEGDSVYFICTVPAIWTQKAKQATMDAATRAKNICGFTDAGISLCYEPTAAAAYVLQVGRWVKAEKNGAFMVVDGGGVTVDLVTYAIKNVDPLRLSEVVQGEGKLCGSYFVNKAFESDLMERLKTETYLQAQNGSKSLNSIIQTVMEDFEIWTKRRYPEDSYFPEESDAYCTYTIHEKLKDNRRKGFSKGDIFILRQQLEDAFVPVLKQCGSLIRSQLKKAYEKKIYPEQIFLVGGFARSARYREHIEAVCEKFTAQHAPHKDIELVHPGICESAIAQGAIRYFLDTDFIQSYYTRSCICITRDIQDDQPTADLMTAVFQNPLDNKQYVHNCVHILLGANEIIPSKGRVASKTLYRTVPANEDIAAISIQVFAFEGQTPVQDRPLELQSDTGKNLKLLYTVGANWLKEEDHCLLGTVDFEVEIAPIRDQLRKMRLGTEKPLRPSNSGKKRGQSCGNYYFSVVYTFEVEFIQGLMKYWLKIPNVKGSKGSIEGRLNLAAVVEPYLSAD